jgi:hypothetical protein
MSNPKIGPATAKPPQQSPTTPLTLSSVQMRTLLLMASSQSPVDAVSHEQSSTWEQLAAARSGVGIDRELLERAMNPNTPLSALRHIKDVSKQLLARSESLDRRNAAALLYNVVVATAHAYHSTNISSRSLTEQCRLFGELAQAFEGEAIADVFQAAATAIDK